MTVTKKMDGRLIIQGSLMFHHAIFFVSKVAGDIIHKFIKYYPPKTLFVFSALESVIEGIENLN